MSRWQVLLAGLVATALTSAFITSIYWPQIRAQYQSFYADSTKQGTPLEQQ